MRVLFFHAYPHQYAGAQRVTHEVVRALGERGIHAAVVTVDDGPFPERLRQDGVEAIIVRAPKPLRTYGRALEQPGQAAVGIASLPGYWLKLASVFRRWGPSLIHANDHRGALLAAVPARLARVPFIWHLHGTYDSRTITRLGGTLANRILIVSEDTKQRQSDLEGYLHKASILHNGLLTVSEGLTGANVPSEPPVVLIGARTHPDKALDVFIRSAAQVLRERPDVRFRIAGPIQRGYEDHHRQLTELAGQLGLREALEFVGVVADPQHEWSLASVYVQCSRKEPFGMGVLEAMALGVPVVTTRVGGMKEIVEDGRSGLQVDPEDHHALATATLQLLNDEDLRNRLTAGALTRVETTFSKDAMVDRLLRVYTEVL